MSEQTSNRMRALRPFESRDYRLLFMAVGIEVFGTGMWTIVMVFQVLALDDSPLALSAVATGMSLGLFLFSIFGGVVADRFSKRKIIITVQGLTAAMMTGVAILSMTGTIELWHVGAASFVMGAGSAFFYPAYSAYLPHVLPPEQLLAANGLEGALRPSMGQGLGPALGGVIVGLTTAKAIALVHDTPLIAVNHLEAHARHHRSNHLGRRVGRRAHGLGKPHRVGGVRDLPCGELRCRRVCRCRRSRQRNDFACRCICRDHQPDDAVFARGALRHGARGKALYL